MANKYAYRIYNIFTGELSKDNIITKEEALKIKKEKNNKDLAVIRGTYAEHLNRYVFFSGA